MGRHASDDADWVTGFIPCIMYKLTGDRTYAGMAWKLLKDQWIAALPSTDGNFYRRWGIRAAIIFDWTYDTLSDADKRSFFTAQNTFLDYMVQENADGTPVHFRSGDTDEIMGWYEGILLAYAVAADENSHVAVVASKPWLGGFSATAADYSTVRNEWFLLLTDLGKGGAWPESVYYDGFTMPQLMLAHACLRTSFGTDYVHEAPPYFTELTNFWLALTTPDLRALYLWGDEGEPGRCRDFSYRGAYLVAIELMAAAVADDSSARSQALSLVYDVVINKESFDLSWLPDEALFFWQPLQWLSNYTTLQPRGYYSDSTAGIGLFKTGWSAAHSLLGVEFSKSEFLDHMTLYHGDVQLYRKGEWVWGHLAAYGAPTSNGQEGTNTLKIAGFPLATDPYLYFVREVKELVGWHTGNDLLLAQGVQAGAWRQNGSWAVPLTVQHEHTRTVVYLPSSDQSLDTVLLYDRLHVLDPRNMPDYNIYRDEEKRAIEASFDATPGGKARSVFYAHAPSVPSISSNALSWVTPAGQHARLRTLAPTSVVYGDVADENKYNGWGECYSAPSELRYHVPIAAAAASDFDVALHVLRVWDDSVSGDAAAEAPVRSDDGRVTGVMLRQPDRPDDVVLFNSAAGPLLPSPSCVGGSGGGPCTYLLGAQAAARGAHRFTLSVGEELSATVPAGTPDLRLIVADLEPGAQYSVTVGAVSATAVEALEGGVLVVTLHGVGSGSKVVSFTKGSEPPAVVSSVAAYSFPQYSGGVVPSDVGNGASPSEIAVLTQAISLLLLAIAAAFN
eukprot:TRINITY_DN3142_c0_g1_i2.p1 TRINITY_DN3142_c0_g1~~TRINITY_DN3142_c0_g1_i2.p1  ORF type:complete len:788 (-),score=188.17 TRINITY_DN3142_c0_g1_i2:2303-4666(-)